jgi:hypothetical protein
MRFPDSSHTDVHDRHCRRVLAVNPQKERSEALHIDTTVQAMAASTAKSTGYRLLQQRRPITLDKPNTIR